MMATPNEAVRTLGAILSIALIAGCTSTPSDPVGDTGANLEIGEICALPGLTADQWADAAPGCEEMLVGDESFAVTLPDGLVVALEAGEAVCVDTLEAVVVELDAIGASDRGSELRIIYHHTFDKARPLSSGPGDGEPNPQPNIGADYDDPVSHLSPAPTAGPGDGEPNPQPNLGTGEGEPNPQPNSPAMTTSTSTATSSSGSTSTSSDMGDGASGAGAAAVGGVAGTTSS